MYRPFGALVQNSGGTSTVPERGFTGQRFEPSVGIYDYNARWYDPAIARFVQPDAIADAFDPQSLNPFSYVRNDPTNLTDPTGNYPGTFGAPIGHSGWCPHFNLPNFTFTPGWAPRNDCGFLGCVTPPNLVKLAVETIFKRVTGMSLPPVDLIFSILTNPIGTIEMIVDSVANPAVDFNPILPLTANEQLTSGLYLLRNWVAELDQLKRLYEEAKERAGDRERSFTERLTAGYEVVDLRFKIALQEGVISRLTPELDKLYVDVGLHYMGRETLVTLVRDPMKLEAEIAKIDALPDRSIRSRFGQPRGQ